MIWLDRPAVVVSGEPFVMAGKQLPWTRFNLAEIESAEFLSEAEFLQRFSQWGLPETPKPARSNVRLRSPADPALSHAPARTTALSPATSTEREPGPHRQGVV
ncbi:hypothetical protein ABEG18_05715 [Alsobacter sp. KACC 23698]|uniref:Uncharacterized protein n=1 Tax=Alsobacter sp. KACC 23698 TaxID=3149229 RepID=A0AAU7JJ45_9HYPH